MSEVSNMITNLYKNKSYLEWNQLYNKETLLSITRTDKDEETHSLFIRYILDPRESHGLGTLPLEMFLRLLVVRNVNNNIIQKYMNKLLKKKQNLEVIVSVPEKTDRKARYDIFMELNVDGYTTTIIIENKVLSSEGEYQTKKYAEYSKDYTNPILVWLCNYSECESDKFIKITYQDLLDFVIQPILYTSFVPTNTKNLLKDYIRVLSHIETKGRSVCLAMSDEEKNMLRNLYVENKDLFGKMLEALTDEELTSEEKQTYKEALQISNNHRVKWSYKGQRLTSKDLVLTIVREQLQMGNSIENLSKYKMHSDPLVVAEEKTKEDGYTKQELNGMTYYVRTCCDMKDVLNLIEKLNIEVMKIED